MTATDEKAASSDDGNEGIGTAAYTYMTDPVGLVFEEAIPADRPGLSDWIDEQARREAVSVEDIRERIEKTGFARYVLEQLGAGHVSTTMAANFIGGHYHDFYRMAYSTGALTMPPSLLATLQGKVDDSIDAVRKTPGLVVKEIAYASTIEDLFPLYAEVAYDPTRTNAPVIILQHGDYPGSRLGSIPGLIDFVRAGFFAIAVSKRARDGSAGQGDSWCRETHDIYDALQHCLTEYAEYVAADNVTIIGQSGGGMDTAACVVRFPDTFRCAVDIAGTLDVEGLIRAVGGEEKIENVGESGEVYADANRAFFELMSRDMGGRPDDVPDRCMARDVSQCGVNNPYTRTFFIWDEQDGGVELYEPGTTRYVDEQRRHGYTNTEVVVTKVGDPIRFFHWIHADQTIFRHRFVPAVLSGTFPAPVLSPAGKMVIPGFVVTKRFSVWLGQGDDAVARLEYQLSGDGGEFRFTRLSSDPTARGRLVIHRGDGSDHEVSFGLDDIVRVPSA